MSGTRKTIHDPIGPPPVTEPTDTSGMATVVYGDAVALGEDTLTLVDVKVDTKQCGRVTISNGKATAVAAAESADDGTAYADATTDVATTGADLVIIRMTNQSSGDTDSSYDISATSFTAIDLPLNSRESMVVTPQNEYDSSDDPSDLQGNVAIVIFDAQVSGDDTLVIVDAYALAIEDELSLSTVMITSVVG
jgi:hypothetical protein